MQDRCNSYGGPHLSSSVMTIPWEDLKKKKPTTPTEDIEETTMACKPKIPYPRCLHKENMEERYAKIIDLIKEVRINVPSVDVLGGIPNYGKFLKDLMRNKIKIEKISTAFLNEECFAIVQNKLLPKLGNPRSFPIQCTLANSVECLALVDLGASINLMSYSLMDVIDEVTEEELDALLNDSEPFSNTSKKINESSLDKEFEEFIDENLRINTSIQDPPIDLEMKPLLKHLEYEFLEKDSLLPVVISALLKDDVKKHLMFVLKKHKEAFAWKTSDILGISLSFCKHKINFEDDAKPVIQRQQFDIEIKNKKEAENVAADHLSRLENPNLEELKDEDINDNFPDETLMNVSSNDEDEFPLKWYGPFVVKYGFAFGYVELYDKHGGSFIVNGHRVKLYHDEEQINKLTTEEIHLMLEEGKMKALPLMTPFPADYRKTMPWVVEKPFIYSVVENTCNKAKLYDSDETGEGIVKGNFLYIKKDPSKKPSSRKNEVEEVRVRLMTR
nr:reverse transcriptase domain-containing protein [Tanacetum cinerariifolium]